MTLNLTLSLIAIFTLIGFSAFFAGSETALTAVSKARMYHLANEGSRAAENVNRLIGDRERLIGALLLGNTFVNILASSLATEVTLQTFPENGVAIAAFAMTAIVLIFGEVLPKTLAIARTDRGWASRFGELGGFEGVRPRRRVEFYPYVAGSSRVNGNRDKANP